ncbi:MAG: flagellar M-ring protein FliF [Magnetococcales bacterium]|nr:flagellar M-ring protein FliF [Magnetococcales bacterium]NGZ27519.1 flagellar M-ring protein FliF [Magnetococcales bacterium]
MAELAQDMADSGSDSASLMRLLSGLPLGGRNGLIVAAVATLLALSSLIWFATRPAYKTLFSGMPEEEAGKVVEMLNKMNVPYQLTGKGTTIQVPGDRVYDLRLELATRGIPKKVEGAGFELFDKTNLMGMTDFMQRMNYQRALQAELAHTIETIAAVETARVHLVLPKKSMFVDAEQHASASVVLALSKSLSQAQIDGIVHLVSSSVEGLDESRVTVVDNKGNMVAGGKTAPQDGRMPVEESLTLQKQVEKSLEERVQTMLDRVLGSNRSIIRVTAELDLSRVERQEEKFDPDGQVARSEQTTNESSRGVFGAGGVPGVTPNDPNANAAAGGSSSNQTRDVERETINYEISKTVNKILLPVGTIKRLSVAVLVDGIYKPGKEGAAEYHARDEEEMVRLQKIIKHAVGFRSDRGDTIEVTNAPFEPIVAPDDTEARIWQQREFYLNAAKMAGMGLLILLIIFYVMRPLVRKLLIPERVAEKSGLPSTVADLEQQLLAEGIGSLPSERPTKMVIPDKTLQMSQQMISDHADEARDILRFWMGQD